MTMIFFWHQLNIHRAACNHDTYLEYYHTFSNPHLSATEHLRFAVSRETGLPPHRGQEKEAQEVAEDGAIMLSRNGCFQK